MQINKFINTEEWSIFKDDRNTLANKLKQCQLCLQLWWWWNEDCFMVGNMMVMEWRLFAVCSYDGDGIKAVSWLQLWWWWNEGCLTVGNMMVMGLRLFNGWRYDGEGSKAV